MKNISLIATAGIIVVANAFALLHAARNRAVISTAELTLTSRELNYYGSTVAEDDSGVTLNLQWNTLGAEPYGNASASWLDSRKLQALGFDCRVDAASDDAARFYQRQRARQAFVALEYDGQSWPAWLSAYKVSAALRNGTLTATTESPEDRSHLVAIDAGSDAHVLRSRYPDRSSVIIVPAVIAVYLDPGTYVAENSKHASHPRIIGRIDQLNSSVHVPRPFSDAFPRHLRAGPKSFYTVRLKYGALFEPWVTQVTWR